MHGDLWTGPSDCELDLGWRLYDLAQYDHDKCADHDDNYDHDDGATDHDDFNDIHDVNDHDHGGDDRDLYGIHQHVERDVGELLRHQLRLVNFFV